MVDARLVISRSCRCKGPWVLEGPGRVLLMNSCRWCILVGCLGACFAGKPGASMIGSQVGC